MLDKTFGLIDPTRLYPVQEDAIEQLQYHDNAIISAPTGIGKTLIFLILAFKKLNKNKNLRLIITSPIKALSTQRYEYLKDHGFYTALETGDCKSKMEDWDILCCTIEIYRLKYINDPNVVLVLDEFHYGLDVENAERTRAHIESIMLSKAQAIYICSATLIGIQKLQKYLRDISDRKFSIFQTNERATELVNLNEISLDKIKNALVIAFSVKHCEKLFEYLYQVRHSNKSKKNIGKRKTDNEKLVLEYAKTYKIDDKHLIRGAKLGIAMFHGKILPKEKRYIAALFEKEVIDTIVGTNALALGVNFPVEKVVFADLPSNKNLFDQIIGRAGRKGYFEKGYYGYSTFIIEQEVEAYNSNPSHNNKISLTEEIDTFVKGYKALAAGKNEPFVVPIMPDYELILKNDMSEAIIMQEVNYIDKYTIGSVDEIFPTYDQIKSNLSVMESYVETKKQVEIEKNKKYKKQPDPMFKEKYEFYEKYFMRYLKECYFNELDVLENCDFMFTVLKIAFAYDYMLKENADYYKEASAYTAMLDLKHLFFSSVMEPDSVLAKYPNKPFSLIKLEEKFIYYADRYFARHFAKDIAYYYLLLKVRKYITRMPADIACMFDVSHIEKMINLIDDSTLNPDETVTCEQKRIYEF